VELPYLHDEVVSMDEFVIVRKGLGLVARDSLTHAVEFTAYKGHVQMALKHEKWYQGPGPAFCTERSSSGVRLCAWSRFEAPCNIRRSRWKEVDCNDLDTADRTES
jgi:hypothetical protein